VLKLTTADTKHRAASLRQQRYLFVTLSSYEVCKNVNAIKQCKFQNNGGIAYRKVCSYASIFNFQWTPGFSLSGKFIPKIANFGHFGGGKPTF